MQSQGTIQKRTEIEIILTIIIISKMEIFIKIMRNMATMVKNNLQSNSLIQKK